MKGDTKLWSAVAGRLIEFAQAQPADRIPGFTERWQLNEGQRASLIALAQRLPRNGVVIADEVGMGKTRLAAAVARAVTDCGGRAAIVVPPGLGFQWNEELRDAGVESNQILRSLWQYLAAWQHQDSTEYSPWSNSSVVLVSHLFANWRLGIASQAMRWSIVPEIYARWRAHRNGRVPRYFHQNELLGHEWVTAAAESVVSSAKTSGNSSIEVCLDELLNMPWKQTLSPAMYSKDGALRDTFEQIIGFGLGAFDLIVIDEAHKGRGAESGVSRLLERAFLTTNNTRRLGLTATPVELDPAQWTGTLARIGARGERIESAITTFAEAARNVRLRPSDALTRSRYFSAANSFQNTLSDYLLRRDKREDDAVRGFADHSGLGFHAYRRESEVVVDPNSVSLPWRRAVCAAEALSHMGIATDGDARTKRLRLTMGSGHGVATLIDEPLYDAIHDRSDNEASAGPVQPSSNPPQSGDKRAMRHSWWRSVLKGVLSDGLGALYNHPGILAAVHAIEDSTESGEKVLVFGRYTRPMRAVVDLLNAREMLRAVESDRLWAQAKIPEQEWPAVEAAHVQLGLGAVLDHDTLDGKLKAQYAQLEIRRMQFRDTLLDLLDQGIQSMPPRSSERVLFEAFRSGAEVPGNEDLIRVARAIHVSLASQEEEQSPDHVAVAFADIIGALRARNEGDEDGNGTLEEGEASELWPVLSERLAEEFSRAEGDFARFMYGNTKPETRRLLQLGFNREHSMPRVLVAQSTVGREGLNLHRACRTVVLLHPEWNPGVVEQQIGRVDRVGSRWEQQCKLAIDSGVTGDALPRIEIRPVVFKGTYDEQNWKVLRQRWEDLRAQLHGVVIPESEAGAYQFLGSVVDEINAAAPNFSPLRQE